MGLVQPGTRRGMFLQMIGSLKTVPPRMFRIVPLGLFHIFFSLNSVRTEIRQTHHRATRMHPEPKRSPTGDPDVILEKADGSRAVVLNLWVSTPVRSPKNHQKTRVFTL